MFQTSIFGFHVNFPGCNWEPILQELWVFQTQANTRTISDGIVGMILNSLDPVIQAVRGKDFVVAKKWLKLGRYIFFGTDVLRMYPGCLDEMNGIFDMA